MIRQILIRDAKGVVRERINIGGCQWCTEDAICSVHQERARKAQERLAEDARDDNESNTEARA